MTASDDQTLKLILPLTQLYLLVFPFGQLLRFTVFSPEIHLYLTDLLVGVTVILYLVHLLHSFSELSRSAIISFISHPLSLFLLWALFTLIFNPLALTLSQLLISALYLVRLIAYFLFFLAIKATLVVFPKDSAKLYISLIISGTLFLLFAFLQLGLFPDLSPLQLAGWDPHYHRLVGTLLDPGYTGVILTLFLSFLLSASKVFSQLRLSRTLFGYLTLRQILIALTFTAIIFTYSRASYLALLAGLAVFSWVKKSPKVFIIAFTLVIASVAFLPRPPGEGGHLARTSTILFRLVNYQQSLTVFSHSPLTGVGFNTYRYAQANFNFLPPDQVLTSHSAAGVDNSWLFILATTGVVGFTLFTWFVIRLYQFLRRSAIKSSSYLLVVSSLSTIIVHSQFHNTLFYPWVMGWIAVIYASAFYPAKST
jgi:O-antigen ligase